MKRKLKINRETLRNLVDESLQDAAGGGVTVNLSACYSCYVSCNGSCTPGCTFAYSVCVRCI
jgi:hypothetical protein